MEKGRRARRRLLLRGLLEQLRERPASDQLRSGLGSTDGRFLVGVALESHRRVEAVVYFYIVYSLLSTMTVLRKRSQMAKLEFFLRLRSVLLGGFLLVTAALGLFSICVFYYYKPQMWTLQWLWGRGDGVMA